MPLKSKLEFNSDGTQSVYVIDTEDPTERHLAFLINPGSKHIDFYPREEFFVPKIELQGFKKIPPEISELGYF